MSEEEYLQIKVRDLKEEIVNLESKILELKETYFDIEKEIIKRIDSAMKNFEPLLKIDNQLKVLEETISFRTMEKLVLKLNEFIDETKHHIKKTDKNFGEKINIGLNSIMEEMNERAKNIHLRIDSLVNILNERGITNIDTYKINERTKEIYKKFKLKSHSQRREEEI